MAGVPKWVHSKTQALSGDLVMKK